MIEHFSDAQVGCGLAAGPPLAFTPGMTRPDGRQFDQLRPISFIPNVAPHATGSVLDLARAKLARKGCDLLVVNDVSGGAVFGSPDNEAVILEADGSFVEVPHGSKGALAHAIWDRVTARWAAV